MAAPGIPCLGKTPWAEEPEAIVHEVASVKYNVTAKIPPLDSENCVRHPKNFLINLYINPRRPNSPSSN